ncbi:MAG: hypothetical protein ACT4ON_08105, partial [Bacteroidota bacterium]
VQTTVMLRFSDTVQYDDIRLSVDPITDPLEFIKQYTGVMEVEAKDKLSFAASFHMKTEDPENDPEGLLRTEAISLPDTLDPTGLFISCRDEFIDDGIQEPIVTAIPIVQNTAFLRPDNCIEHKVMVENIKYVRFSYENYYPGEIYIETYADFFTGANVHEEVMWGEIGSGFSLSIEDTEVLENRLDNNDLLVDGNWPKFNERNLPETGAFTVKTQNYIDRWSAQKGLKYGIETYLEESRSATNLTAIVPEKYDSTGQNYTPANNDANIDISYLEVLQMIGMDYHNARMMGLGHIDLNVIGEQEFIYLSVYDTVAALEPGSQPLAVRHFYMTLPTGRADSRLPQPPVLKDIQYGIEIPSHPKPLRITDEKGYVPHENKRYISLYREEESLDRKFSPIFFEEEDLFCSEDITDAVFLGVEYRLSSESGWRVPELLCEPPLSPNGDPEFADNANISPKRGEIAPLMAINDSKKAIFVHEETEEGQHVYALYAINWFSRTSATGNNECTDVTVFPKINTLLPPSKFGVQLIQKEGAPMFTTAFEQGKLAAINTGTTTDNEILVRAEFNWNHVQIHAYQFRDNDPIRLADKAQLFFRAEPPNMVRGKITAVNNISDDKVEVTAGSYIIFSSTTNSGGELITPVITGDETKFKASLLVAGEKSYLVESVSQLVPEIKFILKKVLNVEANDISNSVHDFTSPEVGEIFAVIENLSADTSWSNNQLAKEVELINFTTDLDENGDPVALQTHRETVTEKDGTSKIQILGGMFDKAEIEQAEETVLVDPEDPNGGTMLSPIPGVYIISFNTIQLADHPDPEVQWVKGTARIALSPPNVGDKKLLDVWSIDRSLSTLKLMVFDPTSGDPGYIPIQTGTNVLVNYHPGYRAYFVEETLVNFDKDTILPEQGALFKETYMAIRSQDSTALPEPLESYLATPVILHAREIVQPLPPAEPIGPLFATRPDFYGKSTYTFDTIVNTENGRIPFSLVFYRANERTILDELYKQETVEEIISDVANVSAEDAEFNNSRWYDLVNGKYGLVAGVQTAGKLFNQYVVGGYRFPIPDNDQYKVQDPNDPDAAYIFPFDGVVEPGEIIELVKLAITDAFLPLTEQPVLYRDIPDGYQTSGRKPTLRDSNKNRLVPGDVDYDPNPMAVKYVDGNNKVNVRFTDYSLDGPSINIYFYYGQELANNMEFSIPGDIAGPIRMVNSYPAQPPQIRKFTTQLDNPITGDVAAVLFEINSYIPSERITKIQIYRALNIDDARSIRTMKMAKEVTIEDTGAEIWTLMDDFEDVEFPLFGETLFYRLVAIRTIRNEKNQLENIPSLESELVLGSIVDVFNPPAPELSFNAGSLTSVSPAALPGVKLKWNKVAHNATYYLYKMNETGNWELLDKFKSNDQNLFYKAPADLVKEDEDGNTIYHRFKVDVENASGLLNLEENPIVI